MITDHCTMVLFCCACILERVSGCDFLCGRLPMAFYTFFIIIFRVMC